jgi:hypothetical protein
MVKLKKKITKKCIFPLKFLNFLAPGSRSTKSLNPDPIWIRKRIPNPGVLPVRQYNVRYRISYNNMHKKGF